MQKIVELENAIIKRLQETITDVAIEKSGVDPMRYKLTHPKGAVLVHYLGSSFFVPSSYNALEQKMTYQFAVSLFVRELHGNTGAYELLQAVKDSLSGYKIFKNKLLPLSIRLVKAAKGLWNYELKMELSLPTGGA